MTANIIWKAANADPGIVGANATGSAPAPPRPAGIPITSPTSRPNAIPYPATNHTTATTPSAMNDSITVPSTFFDRTSPP